MDSDKLRGIKIKEFRKAEELSAKEFAEKYGFKVDNVYKWQKGTKPSDPEEFMRLESVLKLEPVPPVKTKETFLETLRKQKNIDTPFTVPFMTAKAQSGYVKAVDQEFYLDSLEKYALPPGVNGRGAVWRYWEIEGDSMEPVFHERDIILTSQVHQMDWENLRNFYSYVIVTKERVLFKRIYCKNDLEWVLISENEENYPQQLIPVENIKEVWVYRKTWSTNANPSKKFEIKV